MSGMSKREHSRAKHSSSFSIGMCRLFCALLRLFVWSLCVFLDAFEHKTSLAFTQAARGAHVGQVLGLKSSVAARAGVVASWSWRSRM